MAKEKKVGLDEVATIEKAEVKEEKLSPFLEAYKKQNPTKYEAKRARGELKGL